MPTDSPWIQTISGKKFPLLNPTADVIDIHDIAHGLSMLCRFTGQCRLFYSVAEHSVHVSHLVPPQHAGWGLLHDAAEAYLGDIASPLKRKLGEFVGIENALMDAIANAFNLGAKDPSIKYADKAILRAERRALMVVPPEPWPGDDEEVASVDDGTIKAWSPAEAETQFLARFGELFGGVR